MADNPLFTAGKQGYLMQFTDEQLASVTPITFLGAEDLAAARAQRKAETQAYARSVDVRLMAAHPALQPVIAHHCHDEDGNGCNGCDAGAYAEDTPEWPCSTIELILEGLGPHMAGDRG